MERFVRLAATALVALCLFGCKSTFLIHPYLQNPGPKQITIMFETLTPGPSIRYRQKGSIDFRQVSANPVADKQLLFRSQLTGLQPDTVYEYQVVHPLAKSNLYEFRTWPEDVSATDSKKIVLFSDSQGDHPWRLGLITSRGIIDKECSQGLVANCVNEIAAIVVPGDIVTAGDNPLQWRMQFFNKIKEISPYVPILPAIGNHDQPNTLWKHYFEVPDNQESAFAEQWYRVDYGNIRWLTMDTNVGQDSEAALKQLQWLDQVLASAASDETVDFLLMQFHHPCKSVFWVPGESPLSCQFVARLEAFTAQTGKPSGHFFGHTHAYSRGNSRDVKHLWTNVASSAGNIDYWGEYEQRDYDEFYMNFDEYGFNVLHILGANESSEHNVGLRLVRRTGGQDLWYYDFVDEEIRDDITIYRQSELPERPVALVPHQQTVLVDQVFLQGSEFMSEVTSRHLESHWQVEATDQSWRKDYWGNRTRSVHYWFDRDTQMGVDITTFKVEGLEPEKSYRWRVRYRDEHLSWSAWSDYGYFVTAP